MASSTETLELSGRTALVTGGSAGIGRATAAALAAAGARVIVVARGERRLREAAAEVGADWLVADVTDGEAVRRLAAASEERFGGAPDIVVCAAGAFALAPIATTDAAEFDALIAANLRGPFLVYRAFLRGMLARGRGHLIGIGSIAGRSAFPHNGAYSASKFGLRGLHAVLDVELRGTGVRSTLVEPAATDTSLWDSIDAEANPGLPPREAMMPPAAVADAVVFAATRRVGVDVRNLILESA